MEFLSSTMAGSKRLHRFLLLTKEHVVGNVEQAVSATALLKQAWADQGMTAAMQAWPKNPDGTFVGFNAKMADLVELAAFLDAVAAVLDAHAPVVAKLKAVK